PRRRSAPRRPGGRGARTSAAPAARRRTRRSGSCSCRRRNRCRDGEGKIDGEDRAASLPIRRLEARALGLSDGGADGQAETAAPFLGREERVENPLEELRRDAGTSVHDGTIARSAVVATSTRTEPSGGVTSWAFIN